MSFYLGFNCHSKRGCIIYEFSEKHMYFLVIYSILRGLLMIPYIILFFPFMFMFLIPAIFSKKYYYTILLMYFNSLMPDCYNLDYDYYD